jgi:hypothetical protein
MVTATLAASMILGGQGHRIDPSQVVKDAFAQIASGQYFPAVHKLENACRLDSGDDKAYIGQFLAYAYSFVGAYSKAEMQMDLAVPPDPPTIGAQPKEILDAKPVDAVREIVKAAQNRQIVILNESHLEPRSRALALLLARQLRKEGFEYFAAETFTSSVFDAWLQGHPTLETGRYSLEPCFGDLVRQAIKLGYKPMNYEAENLPPGGDGVDRINAREIAQSENLISRLLKPHPKARIFIYCGGDHVTEGWKKMDGKDLAWMAARLKKATGIDPLTIDQTAEIQHGIPSAESPEYRYADSHGLLRGPAIFMRPNKKWAVFGEDFKDGGVDMQVFHPRDTFVHGRPAWLSMNGYRLPVRVKIPPKESRVEMLIQAFVASETADTIPMDQIWVKRGETIPDLMLPKGRYRIVVQHADGTSLTLSDLIEAKP